MEPSERAAQWELQCKLRQAVKFGHLDEIVALLEQGAHVDATIGAGTPPLVTALKYKQMEAFHLLLEHGADVSESDGRGNTPLIMAAEAGNYELVRLLLERGADADFENFRGWSALRHAKTIQIADLLLDYGATLSPIIPPEWLLHKVVGEEAEEQIEYWQADSSKGDEIWWWSNSEQDWLRFAGRSGYALIHNGRLVLARVIRIS